MSKPVYCTDAHDLTMLRDAVGSSLLSDDTATRISDIFSALADPTRIRIISLLMENEICVGDLCLLLDMTQPAISHHLRIMRNLRVVSSRKEGRHVFYTLADQHIKDIFSMSAEHVAHD